MVLEKNLFQKILVYQVFINYRSFKLSIVNGTDYSIPMLFVLKRLGLGKFRIFMTSSTTKHN